jgi:hypothetical protein
VCGSMGCRSTSHVSERPENGRGTPESEDAHRDQRVKLGGLQVRRLGGVMTEEGPAMYPAPNGRLTRSRTQRDRSA